MVNADRSHDLAKIVLAEEIRGDTGHFQGGAVRFVS